MIDYEDPRTWPTNYERARELLKKADDLEWSDYGKEDTAGPNPYVDYLRSEVTRLMQDPYGKEPPF